MKKKLLAMLLVATTAVAFAFSGCGGGESGEQPSHSTHTYDKQVAEAEYLASEATCTDKAKYYYSCECGELGTETFESGEFAAHTFNKQVAEKLYLKSRATISKKAQYYYSCKCGECGTETFEHGEKLIPTQGLDYELNNEETEYSVKGIGEATDTDIVIPAEVEGKPVTSIGEMAFFECGEITSVYIPDSVTTLGMFAFAFCSGITSISISDSVTNIGDAFFYCSALTSITVDENNAYYKGENECILSKDGKTLILGCKNSVIPDSVINIGESAFAGCSGLTGALTLSENIISIGAGAFSGCSGLTTITLPKGLTCVENCTFEECRGLTAIIIPDSVTSIGSMAFFRCDKLTSIIIPVGVTSIGGQAFAACCENFTVYCEVESQPADWHFDWDMAHETNNNMRCSVVWGYKG